MLFNSPAFLAFFPCIVTLFFITADRWRWAVLLGASYFFYMAWLPEYAVLLLFATVTSYGAAVLMERAPDKASRRPYMWAGVLLNAALLFFFKYYDWFADNVRVVAGQPVLPLAHLILPVGISFYTMQSMSYVLDVYRGRMKAERHFGVYALYVSYFPQLVAGPIERAPNLIHQLWEKHRFDYRRVLFGLQLMMWGMFKKAVVADRLAIYAEAVYQQPAAHDGITLVVGTVLFGFQLYCDFSGYSDIAIGAAQVMGISLMINFKRPYFSRNIEELWGKRWHISLVSWITDYIYNPLSYATRRSPAVRRHANIIIVFFITGLWHGADWRFVLWGAMNGAYVLLHVLSRPVRKWTVKALRLDRVPRFHSAISIVFTFTIFAFGSVFFLAKDLGDALLIISRMPVGWAEVSAASLKASLIDVKGSTQFALSVLAVGLLFVVEFVQERGSIREWLSARPAWLTWILTYGIILYILLFGVFEQDAFIYFQF